MKPPKVETTSKGFKVIPMTFEEVCTVFGGEGICDWCNNMAPTGKYIAVLNAWYCPECYEAWHERSKYYYEDQGFENEMIERALNLYQDEYGKI